MHSETRLLCCYELLFTTELAATPIHLFFYPNCTSVFTDQFALVSSLSYCSVVLFSKRAFCLLCVVPCTVPEQQYCASLDCHAETILSNAYKLYAWMTVKPTTPATYYLLLTYCEERLLIMEDKIISVVLRRFLERLVCHKNSLFLLAIHTHLKRLIFRVMLLKLAPYLECCFPPHRSLLILWTGSPEPCDY